MCTSCKDGYYPIFEDTSNDYTFLDCYQSPEGYYLDSGYYKPCFESCKKCDNGGDNLNHNCIECKDNYIYGINLNNYKNCYIYNEKENNIFIYNSTDFNNTLNVIFNKYKPENNNNLVIKRADDIIYHISDSKNELELLKNKSNNINNISIIDLGECDTILRRKYPINDNDSFIIIKNEISSNKPSQKNLNFEVYEPYSKQKLNLSLCDSTPINIYFPMELSKSTKQLYDQMKESGYDMFNINDPFYHDICTPFDSPHGTDILITDRINYIYNNDDTRCQSNCNFSYYSVATQYMECSCSTDVNIKNDNVIKDKFNAKKIYESFYDVLKYSNYNILKCYKIITNINNMERNIGSIISLICFCCYFICLLIYICNGLNSLKAKLKIVLKKSKIKDLSNNISKFYNLLYPPSKRKSNKKSVNNVNKGKRNNIIINNIDLSSKTKTINKFNIYSNFGLNYNALENKKFNKLKLNKKKQQNNEKEVKNTKKIEYSDYELNELEYKLAVKLDKRSVLLIYWATLKREHLIFFTFCSCNDYNLVSVKITRFIFLIIGDMALNTFFFSDESMHKLFLNYGKYNFIQQIPEITYSTIISLLIEILLYFLSMTDKYFYLLKSSFVKGDKNEIRKLIKCIKVKLIIFFIFIFIFFVIYCYIISVFCGVYRNTQIAFIKDSALSFVVCLIYPLVLYLISASLRFFALKCKKKSCKCLYKFSFIFPFF